MCRVCTDIPAVATAATNHTVATTFEAPTTMMTFDGLKETAVLDPFMQPPHLLSSSSLRMQGLFLPLPTTAPAVAMQEERTPTEDDAAIDANKTMILIEGLPESLHEIAFDEQQRQLDDDEMSDLLDDPTQDELKTALRAVVVVLWDEQSTNLSIQMQDDWNDLEGGYDDDRLQELMQRNDDYEECYGEFGC